MRGAAANGPNASCRSCGEPLGAVELRLPDAPAGAQALPAAAELPADRGVELRVHACPGCGLVQLDAEPVPYFREVITAAGWSPAMREFRSAQVRGFVARFALQGKRVLEVGTGEGYLLDLLAETKAVAVGVEAGSAVAARARAAGRDVREDYPQRGTALAGAPYDAFVCINFLEHAPRPRDFLSGIHASLREGAVGLLEVPSYEHVLATRRYYDFVADHLSYFTRETLRRTLEIAGFDVLETGTAWHDIDLVAVVRKRAAPATAALMQASGEHLARVRAFLLGFERVAVWGASHQALTLLSLAGAQRVAYVIDSAPFKQGRFTPVTHLPIVAPDHLAQAPVQAVLVMAAGYSDEVARILIQDRGFRGAVGILREHGVEVRQPG